MGSRSYDEFAEHLATILSLDPVDRKKFLVKWSKARVSMKMWADTLSDADGVIECFFPDISDSINN